MKLTGKLIFALCLALPTLSVAEDSTETTGGGDPAAAEFADIAMKFASYSRRNWKIITAADLDALAQAATRLHVSLNTPSQRSLVEVVEVRPTDAHGVQKAAVYNKATGQIQLHRASWNVSDKEKVTLVAMELLGLAGVVQDRYALVTSAVAEDWTAILAEEITSLNQQVQLPSNPRLTNLAFIYVLGRSDSQNPRFELCDMPATKCKAVSPIKAEKINGFHIYTVRPGHYRFRWSAYPLVVQQSSRRLVADVDTPVDFTVHEGQRVALQQQKIILPAFKAAGRMHVRIAPDLTDDRVYNAVLQTAGQQIGPKKFNYSLRLSGDLVDTDKEDIRAYDYCLYLEAYGSKSQQFECHSAISMHTPIKASKMNSMLFTVLSPTKILAMEFQKDLPGIDIKLQDRNARSKLLHQNYLTESFISLSVVRMRKAYLATVNFGDVHELGATPVSTWLSPGRYSATFINESGVEVDKPFEVIGGVSEIHLQM